MRAFALAAVLVSFAAVAACSKVQPRLIDPVRSRGELRVVTLNLPTCYYLGAQGTEGLEFDLASAFAAHEGVKLNMYPVANEGAMQAELAAGRADIAACSLTDNPDWHRAGDAAEPYSLIPQLVVYQRSGVRPRDTLQLESARLAVRAGSPQERILQRLKSTVAPGLQWEETAPSSADPVEDVEGGEAQYAITDAREYSFAHHLYPNVLVGFDAAAAAPGAVDRAQGHARTARERQRILPRTRRQRPPAAAGAGILRRHPPFRVRGIARVPGPRRRPAADVPQLVRAGRAADRH